MTICGSQPTRATHWEGVGHPTPEGCDMDVKEPQEMEDPFWTMDNQSDARVVNQVGKQTPRRNTQNDSPKAKGMTPGRVDGDKGAGPTGVQHPAEVPRAPAVATPAPSQNVPARGSTPRSDWSTRGGNRGNVCWECGDPNHYQNQCPQRQRGDGRPNQLQGGVQLWQNAQQGKGPSKGQGFQGKGGKGVTFAGKGKGGGADAQGGAGRGGGGN